MSSSLEPGLTHISFTVAVGVRGPIDAGTYEVSGRKVTVSYPEQVTINGTTAKLPKSLSTLFVVKWSEGRKGKTGSAVVANDFRRHLPIYDVLSTISELLLAFKLERVGHSDGRGLRAVGFADTLFYFSEINGIATDNINTGLKNYAENNAWQDRTASADTAESNRLARQHIGTKTLPLTRRYVRCFELVEHGLYAEAFLVAFSLLDDFVQKTLHDLLASKGLTDESDRDDLLRGIKDSRLRIYLGPLLKLACGKDIEAMWPAAPTALKWLNTKRNHIAHNAEGVDYASARHAIFACLKFLVVLRENGVANPDITVTVFREAKIMAAWTNAAPDWVPKGELAETMDFRS